MEGTRLSKRRIWWFISAGDIKKGLDADYDLTCDDNHDHDHDSDDTGMRKGKTYCTGDSRCQGKSGRLQICQRGLNVC